MKVKFGPRCFQTFYWWQTNMWLLQGRSDPQLVNQSAKTDKNYFSIFWKFLSEIFYFSVYSYNQSFKFNHLSFDLDQKKLKQSLKLMGQKLHCNIDGSLWQQPSLEKKLLFSSGKFFLGIGDQLEFILWHNVDVNQGKHTLLHQLYCNLHQNLLHRTNSIF